MTTNNAKALPPELYREGRIDEVMVFEGLDREKAEPFVIEVLKTFKKPAIGAKPILDKHYPPLVPNSIGKHVSQAALTKTVQEFVKLGELNLETTGAQVIVKV